MMHQKLFTVENVIHIFSIFSIASLFITVTGFSSSHPSSLLSNRKVTKYLHQQTFCLKQELSNIQQDDKIVELKKLDVTNTLVGLSTEQKILSLLDEYVILYSQAKQSSSLLLAPLKSSHINDWNTEIAIDLIHLRQQEIRALVEDCTKTLNDYRQFEQEGQYTTKKSRKEMNTPDNSHDRDFNDDNRGEGTTSKSTESGTNTISSINDSDDDDLTNIASELNRAIMEAVNSNDMNDANIIELARKYMQVSSSSSSTTASLSSSEAEIIPNNESNNGLGDNDSNKKETNSGSSNSIIYNDNHEEDEGHFELQICRLRSRLEQIKVLIADASRPTNRKDGNEHLMVGGSLLSNEKTKKIPKHAVNANDDEATATYKTTKTTITGSTVTGTAPVVTFSDKKQQFSTGKEKVNLSGNGKEKEMLNVDDEEKATLNNDDKEKIKVNGIDKEKVMISGNDKEKEGILNGIAVIEIETQKLDESKEKLTIKESIIAKNGSTNNVSVGEEGDDHHSSDLRLKNVMGVLATEEVESTSLTAQRSTTFRTQPSQSKEQRSQLVHRDESIEELNDNTSNMEKLTVSTLPINPSLSDGMLPSSSSSSSYANETDVVANLDINDDIKDVSSVSSNNTSAMEDDEQTKLATAVITIFVAVAAVLQTFLQSSQCTFSFCEEATKLL